MNKNKRTIRHRINQNTDLSETAETWRVDSCLMNKDLATGILHGDEPVSFLRAEPFDLRREMNQGLSIRCERRYQSGSEESEGLMPSLVRC